MIVGKAPVLQKTHLAGPRRPVRGWLRSELAQAHLARQRMPVWPLFDGPAGPLGRNAGFGELLADARGALPPCGELADETVGVAVVIEQSLASQLGDHLGDHLARVTLADQR